MLWLMVLVVMLSGFELRPPQQTEAGLEEKIQIIHNVIRRLQVNPIVAYVVFDGDMLSVQHDQESQYEDFLDMVQDLDVTRFYGGVGVYMASAPVKEPKGSVLFDRKIGPLEDYYLEQQIRQLVKQEAGLEETLIIRGMDEVTQERLNQPEPAIERSP